MQWLTVRLVIDEANGITKEYVNAPDGKNAALLPANQALVISISGGEPEDYIVGVAIARIVNGTPVPVGSWSPPNAGTIASGGTTYFGITPNAPTLVGPVSTPNSTPTTITIQDLEALTSGSDAFTYSITVETPAGRINADPEVINESGSGNVEWGDPVPITGGGTQPHIETYPQVKPTPTRS